MFYISTQGHSASAWLARALSVHPKIICWHGTKIIPPYPKLKKNQLIMTPSDFAHGLKVCENNIGGNNFFGSVHGYHGTTIKKYIEEKEGKFFAIFRHPIAKINSMFSSSYYSNLSHGKIKTDEIIVDYSFFFENFEEEINKKMTEFKNKKIQKKKLKVFFKNTTIINNLKMINNSYLGLKKKLSNSYVNKASNFSLDINSYTKAQKVDVACSTFIEACIRTFETDIEIIDNCNFDQIFKMEEFIKSEIYFREILHKIAKLNLDDEKIKEIFNNKEHINIHSKKKKLDEIYKSWPKSFKDLFNEYLQKKELKDTYNKLEYTFY